MTAHELRFALTASMTAEFEQRAAIGLAQAAGRLRTLWFDTPAGDLMNAATSLEVRQTADGWMQAVAHDGDGRFERRSLEQPVAGPRPERDALPPRDDPLGRVPHAFFGLLVPVFEAELERQVRLVGPQPDLRVEVACERGELRAGHRSERIAEVALRRREGPAAAFFHYAAQWAAMHGAQLLLEPMHLRGLELAGWRPRAPRPVRIPPAAPNAGLTVAQAACQAIAGHLDHVVANLLPVRAGTQPQAIHQLRVALRRLRAAIRFFDLDRQEVEPGADGAPAAGSGWRDLARSARDLSAAAAPVRDADVLESGVLRDLDGSLPEDASLHVLRQAITTAREHDRARLRAVLSSPETTAFILRGHAALGTLATGRWAEADFASFAAGRLARLAARAQRRTRRAGSEGDWHRARVALKELRYALECCRALPATRGPADDAIAMLSRWQRSLGRAQDLATARASVARALAYADAPVEIAVRAAALVDGYRASAAALNRPGRLRKPILGGLERLLAPAPPSPAAGYHRVDRSRKEDIE